MGAKLAIMLKLFDRRRWPRAPVREEVTIVVQGKSYPATAINISAGGACLEGCGRCVRLRSRVHVHLPRQGERLADVVWISDDEIGLAFVQSKASPDPSVSIADRVERAA